MGQLQDKIAIVTGGAGSIGLATAKLFVREGARVMLVDLREADLRKAAAELASPNVAFHAGDVGIAADAKAYVAGTVKRWGKIDIVFSNAGNMGAIAPLADYPEESFDDVYRVHVKGALLACKYAASHMNDGGSIIITSSVAGLRGDPGPYAYITAKHAQVGLMRCVAKELAPRRIRVNTIHPGPTRNTFQAGVEDHLGKVIGRDAAKFFDEIIPLGRHASPEEIARSVLYLASEQSSFTTGSTLVVDGGMSG
jgi:NAD(P)-dependent dehydrogenase (short-subunit alcohol dehydrogenase family)